MQNTFFFQIMYNLCMMQIFDIPIFQDQKSKNLYTLTNPVFPTYTNENKLLRLFSEHTKELQQAKPKLSDRSKWSSGYVLATHTKDTDWTLKFNFDISIESIGFSQMWQ